MSSYRINHNLYNQVSGEVSCYLLFQVEERKMLSGERFLNHYYWALVNQPLPTELPTSKDTEFSFRVKTRGTTTNINEFAFCQWRRSAAGTAPNYHSVQMEPICKWFSVDFQIIRLHHFHDGRILCPSLDWKLLELTWLPKLHYLDSCYCLQEQNYLVKLYITIVVKSVRGH